MTDQQIQAQAIVANQLKNNAFLPVVLESVRIDTIAQWYAADNTQAREECWQRLHSLEYLAGAIERECTNAIKRAGDG